MQRRSTTIFLIGMLTLVLGTATTFAALRGPKRAAADTPRTAKAPVPAGLVIPEGRQALAVALDPVAGTAGTAHAGSRINVFAAVVEKNPDDKAARMVLQDVEVLRVDTAALAPAAAPATTTYLLSVTPAQAEKLVFHAAFSKLWFSVLPAGAKPVPPTPGVDTAHQLDPAA
jgi:Flp pilus assembly protein CpaB